MEEFLNQDQKWRNGKMGAINFLPIGIFELFFWLIGAFGIKLIALGRKLIAEAQHIHQICGRFVLAPAGWVT
jgi:hypothetical protein